MKALKLDHVGIAVENLDEAVELYTGLLGLELTGIETVEAQKVRTAFLVFGASEAGVLSETERGTELELLELTLGCELGRVAGRASSTWPSASSTSMRPWRT